MKKQEVYRKKTVKSALILTSSGGGGLIQAAVAKEQELLKLYPKIKITKYDVLKQWAWKPIGPWSVRYWDRAQKSGDVKALEGIISLQRIAEIYFGPKIFCKMLWTLFKQKIDVVIDTQPLGTSAMLKAIRLFNYLKKKQIHLEKVLVDLPTKGATHFFKPIRRLGKKDQPYLRLVTIKPLLDKKQTEKRFWKNNCRLPMKNIQYETFCTRSAFKHYRNKNKHQIDLMLKIDLISPYADSLMIASCEKGCIDFNQTTEALHCKIQQKDWVFTILLGSQPAFDATLNYIQTVIDKVRKAEKDRCYHVFVFCGKCDPSSSSLLESVHDLVQQIKDFPKNLSIIPMPFQKEDVIAPLFFRSNMTLTRSGGQTMMELMEVSKAKFCVHSEAKEKKPTHIQLLRGIPGWESGNACYLEEKYRAKIVTPQIFSDFLFFHFLD